MDLNVKMTLGLHLENKVVLPVSPVPPPLAWVREVGDIQTTLSCPSGKQEQSAVRIEEHFFWEGSKLSLCCSLTGLEFTV